MRCALILLLMLAMPASHAASLYVATNAVENPSATSCPSALPCHLNDASRIAQSNSQDDTILLVGPSTFGDDFVYYPDASDLDRDLTVKSVGGRAWFDSDFATISAQLMIRMTSGAGDLYIEGIGVRNSSGEHTDLYDDSVVKLESASGDVSVFNVSIVSNTLSSAYGAIDNKGIAGLRLITGGLATVEASSFMDNHPGALDIIAEQAIVIDSTFFSNGAKPGETTNAGGAIRIKSATVEFLRNDVALNSAYGEGFAGGLKLNLTAPIPNSGTNSTISDNRFEGNSGIQSPAGISVERPPSFISAISMDRNLFKGNRCSGANGCATSLGLGDHARLLFRSNLMFDNEAYNTVGIPGGNYGSALYAGLGGDAEFHLLNNTITENMLAAVYSAAVHVRTGYHQNRVDIYNNILRGNTTTVNQQADSDLYLEGDRNADVTLRNNNFGVTELYAGLASPTVTESGSVYVYPGFIDAASEDYHLDAASPLIDAGSNPGSFQGPLDMDRQARVQLNGVDIGADEFSGTARRLVSVSKIGFGTGTVNSLPAGISCGYTCGAASNQFDQGITMALLALPSSDSVFVGWGGDCSGSTVGTQFVVTGTTTCTAEFKPLTYRIVVNASGSETGSIGSSFGPPLNFIYPLGGTQRTVTDIPPGSTVEISGLVVNPNTMHLFLGDCEAQGGSVFGQGGPSASCRFTNINANHNITFQFRYGVVLFPDRTLNIQKIGTGQGTVSSVPLGIDCGVLCSRSFFVGTEVRLTASPDYQSRFIGWGADCPSTVAPNITVHMDNHRNCTAEFERASMVIIALGGNASGTLTDTNTGYSRSFPQSSVFVQNYAPGASVPLEAIAPNGALARFFGCSGAGFVLTGDGTANAHCSIIGLNQDANLSVIFQSTESVLTVNATGNGSGQLTSNVGGIAINYPFDFTATSVPISYGGGVLMSTAGGNGSEVYWTGCTGPGAVVTGQGTPSSSCQLSIYENTLVGVEFRQAIPTDRIFADGFD